MANFTSQITILFLQLVFATTFCLTISNRYKVSHCNEKDQETLLIFQKGIIDHFGQLSTWSTEDSCCSWVGVHCDNITGRVTKLDLSKEKLEGEINFTFLELEFLNHVDLSNNQFNMTSPYNLSHAPHLHYLDLSWNHLHMDNLEWLSPHSSLEYLDLSGIDLHKETNWLEKVAMFPSLSYLHLRSCNLGIMMFSPFFKFVNFTSLVTLDLSYNNFNSELPKGLFNFTNNISHVDISKSNIHGEMPLNLLCLQHLIDLSLRYNQIKGSILNSIGQLKNLQHLDISSNMFNGSFPSTLGNLSSLVSLSIGHNSFFGEITETTFSKLTNLKSLDMSYSSSLTFQLDPEWTPPFQLYELHLQNTHQGPNFPSWLYTQSSLQVLDLSSTGISLARGNKFWSFVEKPSYLYLSNNLMSGDISNLTLKSFTIKLSYNNFTGRLPCISPTVNYLDLSYNSFSGSIPRCWKKLVNLQSISLWSNRLSGEVLDLSNLKKLKFMDLGKNEFSGTIPINMPQGLEVIILRANHFEGHIPSQLFSLTYLYHMDLAHNKLSGSIPQCAYNMTQMVTSNLTKSDFATIEWFTKGQDYLYIVKPEGRTIDFSANNLSGEIPLELFQLIQVHTLNLSHNNLIGIIPSLVGGMKQLESLDLSNNKFYGEIPESMTHLTFLGYLNLSCNNFAGKIPIGTQLQSFSASSYIGNPKLCGDPLKKCFKEEENPKDAKASTWDQDGDPLRDSLYLGMGVGFAVGFWGICGSLFLIGNGETRASCSLIE